jgi:flagellar hook-length control protein FliK
MSAIRITGSSGAPKGPSPGGEGGRAEAVPGIAPFAAVLGGAIPAKAAPEAVRDPGAGPPSAAPSQRKRGEGTEAKDVSMTALGGASVVPANVADPTANGGTAPAAENRTDGPTTTVSGAVADAAVMVGAALAEGASSMASTALLPAAVPPAPFSPPSSSRTVTAPEGAADGASRGLPALNTKPEGVTSSIRTVPATASDLGGAASPAGRDAATARATVALPARFDPPSSLVAPSGDPSSMIGAPCEVAAVPMIAAPFETTEPALIAASGSIAASTVNAASPDRSNTGGDTADVGGRDQSRLPLGGVASDAAAVGGAIATSPTNPWGGPSASTGSGDASPPSVIDQASTRIISLASSGPGTITVQLHPPELGALTVRVEINGRDVAAWFESPVPEVQQAISAGIGQLQADLGAAGYNLSGAWVGNDAPGARTRGGNAPTRPSIRAATAGTSPAFSGAAAARPTASGVSIYV